jgi:hypothetical protein
VSRLRVPVGLLAMFVGGRGVLLGLVMLANGMVVGRLVVMMGRGIVVSGGIMMMLGGGVRGLFGHNRSPGYRLWGHTHHVGRQHAAGPSSYRMQGSCRQPRLHAGTVNRLSATPRGPSRRSEKEISRASVAKIVGVSLTALRHFIQTRKLDPKTSNGRERRRRRYGTFLQ